MRRAKTATMPRAFRIARHPARSVEHGDATGGTERRIRRDRRRKALLILLHPVCRSDDLEVPVLSRVTANGNAVRVVALEQIVVARGKAGLAREGHRARSVQ